MHTTTNQEHRDVTTSSDDDQPTGVANEADDTAGPESMRTAAAERHSDVPTTIVPDVSPTQAAELAWSSEADAEELSDHRRGWLLWIPLVVLLCASVAVVVWFSVTLYRQHERPVSASPTSPTPIAAPPRPAPPAPIPDGRHDTALWL
jgi:hypothetical protein